MPTDQSMFKGIDEDDLTAIGFALLNALGTTTMLGHRRPGNTLDYIQTDPDDDWRKQFVWDIIAWTSGRKGYREGAEDRVRGVLADTGWVRSQMTVAMESVWAKGAE